MGVSRDGKEAKQGYDLRKILQRVSEICKGDFGEEVLLHSFSNPPPRNLGEGGIQNSRHFLRQFLLLQWLHM